MASEWILVGLFASRARIGVFLKQGELSDLIRAPIAPLRDALRKLGPEGVPTPARAPASSSSGRVPT